jgi:anti-anti-sigma regulatory factor
LDYPTLEKKRFFSCKIFELDMSEVGAISSEGLSHLFSVLEILQERETKTFITGLETPKHIVSHQTEIGSTTRITTDETALEKEA